MRMRTEQDSLGTKHLPDNAYYGINTVRAAENFPISGIKAHPLLIKAYALLKCACAQSNADLNLLPPKIARAIINAGKEIAAGKMNDQFIVDVFQAGAGTSLNMNMNEVIANCALELMGKKKGDYAFIHPNDHVNMAQSTNDTFPTAMRVALLFKLAEFLPELTRLAKTFLEKGKEFESIIKAGRTHLQDAVPIRLGQEFAAYGKTLQKCECDIKRNANDLLEIGIGGTAVGTGINTHPAYRGLVLKHLRVLTKLPLKNTASMVEIMQSQLAISHISSALKNTAVELIRIANDLRLLSSGPSTGLGEIALPPVQQGSSIMPGKINPSILECATMACMHVIGADHAVSLAVLSGQLELNVFMPLMAYEILHSLDILHETLSMMNNKCIKGITACEETCTSYVMQSTGIITALNPLIGYEKAGEIAKEFAASKKPIKEIILAKKILTEQQLHTLLDPHMLTKPNLVSRSYAHKNKNKT